MAEKTYVGKGKVVGRFEEIAFSICITDATPFFFEYNGKTYCKFKVGKMRSTDEHGKTHTVYVDDFKPDPAHKKAPVDNQVDNQNGEVTPDDIPF